MAEYSYTVGMPWESLTNGAAPVESSRMDGWSNIFTSLNIAGKDPRIENQHTLRAPRTLNEIESMYIQDPLFARIVDAIPEHATRRWINFTGAKNALNKSIHDALEDLDAQQKFSELMRLDRLYGGAALILGVDDGQLPNAPLDFTSIEEVRYLNVYSCNEIRAGDRETDPASPLFGQPAYFHFSQHDQLDVLKHIHPSRVIALRGIQTGGYTSRQQFWGYPIIERVYDSLRRFGTVYGYLEMLFKDLSMGVMKIKDLAHLISTQDGNNLLIKRLALVNMASSTFNAVMIDSEEDFERRLMNFSGIRDGIIACMDELAAVAEMPLSILFGQPPAGLSTDDSGGRTAFYDSIANKQRKLLREPINRVVRALIMSKKGPTRGREPRSWFFTFNPLTEPDSNQEATRQLRLAEIDELYAVNIGAVSKREVRSRLENDPNCPYVLDEAFSAQLDANMAAIGKQLANPPDPLAVAAAGAPPAPPKNGPPAKPQAKPPQAQKK